MPKITLTLTEEELHYLLVAVHAGLEELLQWRQYADAATIGVGRQVLRKLRDIEQTQVTPH